MTMGTFNSEGGVFPWFLSSLSMLSIFSLFFYFIIFSVSWQFMFFNMHCHYRLIYLLSSDMQGCFFSATIVLGERSPTGQVACDTM